MFFCSWFVLVLAPKRTKREQTWYSERTNREQTENKTKQENKQGTKREQYPYVPFSMPAYYIECTLVI